MPDWLEMTSFEYKLIFILLCKNDLKTEKKLVEVRIEKGQKRSEDIKLIKAKLILSILYVLY